MKLVLALALLAGCADRRDRLSDLADRACACAMDAACGVRSFGEMTAWLRDPDRRTADDDAAAGERLIACVAATGVRPSEMMERMKELR